jgi:hypothetical protein
VLQTTLSKSEINAGVNATYTAFINTAFINEVQGTLSEVGPPALRFTHPDDTFNSTYNQSTLSTLYNVVIRH